jgi:hypothetical protein
MIQTDPSYIQKPVRMIQKDPLICVETNQIGTEKIHGCM